jgi:hypothetical protein
MNLEQTVATLSEQYGTDFDQAVAGWDRFFNALGKFAFGGLCVIVVVGIIGLIYTIITKFVLSGDQPLVGIFLALFIVFAALTLVWVIWNESQKEQKAKLPASRDLPGTVPETGKLLPDPIEFPASVTENTTKLLPVENKSLEH